MTNISDWLDTWTGCCTGGGGGGDSDFDTAKITFNIGSGVGSLEYTSQISYPPENPDSSNQYSYRVVQVIGNTQDPVPRPELESTQEDSILIYQGMAYLSPPYIYSCLTGDEITTSGYTLSGAAETIDDEESDFNGMIKVTGNCTITITRE